MPILTLIILLCIIGFLLYLVNAYIPMQATIKKILNIAVVVAVVLWLLNLTGFLSNISTLRVGR